jgi:hypothetical protein
MDIGLILVIFGFSQENNELATDCETVKTTQHLAL